MIQIPIHETSISQLPRIILKALITLNPLFNLYFDPSNESPSTSSRALGAKISDGIDYICTPITNIPLLLTHIIGQSIPPATMDIHRCRFVDYTPHAVTALAFSHPSSGSAHPPQGLRLALGRSNGDIEIWSPRANWTHEMTLPGARGRTVEGLVWAAPKGSNLVPRLFSIGGSTYITEWDLRTLRPKANYDCNAGVIWCIDANEAGDKLAVGCDDGSVVLVDISGGPGVMEHDMICQRQDQRVLGLSFYGNSMIVAGCADALVRCWQILLESEEGRERNGRIVGTMKVDRSKTESTLVWTVVAFPERGQFVTGDSTGSVKVWDAKHFTMVLNFATHEADVLCLARNAAGDKLFSAGIDRKVHQYTCLRSRSGEPKKQKARWINNGSRLVHANDVRAMAIYESRGFGVLVSGGVERSFIVQEIEAFENGPFKKVLMDQQISNIFVQPQTKLVALFQDQTVKIWRLADHKHKLVAKLTLADDDNITSVSIGDEYEDGKQFLAVSSINSLRVFALEQQSTKLAVTKIRDEEFDSAVAGAKKVWVYKGTKLLVLTPENEFYKFKITSKKIELVDEIESIDDGTETAVSKSGIDYYNSIRCVSVAPDFSKLVLARFNDAVEVLPLEGKQKAFLLTKPSTSVHLMDVTADNTVVVMTQENKIYEFLLKRGGKLLTEWSEKNSDSVPRGLLKQKEKPMGLFVNDNKAWVYGSTWMAFVDLTRNMTQTGASRGSVKRNRDGLTISDETDVNEHLVKELLKNDEEEDEKMEEDGESKDKPAFWMTQKYRPILKVAAVQLDLLVVERDAFALPQALAFDAPVYRV